MTVCICLNWFQNNPIQNMSLVFFIISIPSLLYIEKPIHWKWYKYDMWLIAQTVQEHNTRYAKIKLTNSAST